MITNTVLNKYNLQEIPEIVQFLEKNYHFLSKIQISYPKFINLVIITFSLSYIKKY